jgi:acyl carrier protein phosphodiesterase
VNYLAHSVLSFNDPDLIIGNFIADSIQGNRFDGLTPSIIKGITLHRKIDVYTDSHPIFLTSKYHFTKDFGKYNGVLMDIIYDHYLAKNFHLYSPTPLQEYCSNIYKLLHDNHHYLPEPAKRFYEYMTERNVLYTYSTLQGIEVVLGHLSHRIRHRYELSLAIPVLEKHYDEIEQEFFVFFDDLTAFCKQQEEVTG